MLLVHDAAVLHHAPRRDSYEHPHGWVARYYGWHRTRASKAVPVVVGLAHACGARADGVDIAGHAGKVCEPAANAHNPAHSFFKSAGLKSLQAHCRPRVLEVVGAKLVVIVAGPNEGRAARVAPALDVERQLPASKANGG